MNILKKKETRAWGRNEDGSKYVTGMTVGWLRKELEKYDESVEVLMAVCPKKYWNGGGYLGALSKVEQGIDTQIWLKGLVVDPSLE